MSDNKVIFIVFCLVRTVHKSDLLQMKHLTNGDQHLLKDQDRVVIEDHVF
jgi:hypothetical protein